MAEKSAAREAYEREFFTGMSDPSEWSPATADAMEKLFLMFERGWNLALDARELERAGQTGSGDADTARLDWLQTNGCTVRRADDGKRNLVIWDGGSIRKAIDAARAAMGGKE